MAEQFYNILTLLGQAEYASGISLSNPVTLTHMVLGDANGNYYEPSAGQTASPALSSRHSGDCHTCPPRSRRSSDSGSSREPVDGSGDFVRGGANTALLHRSRKSFASLSATCPCSEADQLY